MLLGEIFKEQHPDVKIPFNVNEGNLLVVNIYIVYNLFNILLAGDTKSVNKKYQKFRPIALFEKTGNHFKFFPLSTDNKNRLKQIKFNLSNCKKISNCDGFYFKNNASVFITYRKVTRNGVEIKIPQKFSLDLMLLEKFINNNAFFQNKKIELGLEKNNPLEYFEICHKCNIDYVKSIAKEIYG